LSEEKKEEKAISRRKYLATAGGLAAAAAVGWGLAGYLASKPRVPAVEKTVTKTITATPGVTTPAVTPAAPVTIEFWQFGGVSVEHELFQKEGVEKFNATHPNIIVKRTERSWMTKFEDLVTAFQTGTAPDVVTTDATQVPDYVEMGMYVAYDEEFPEVLTWKDRFVPEIWERSGGWYKGHFYAIPSWVDAGTFIAYNTEMFKEAGLVDSKGNPKPPTTWDEVIEYAKELNKPPDHYGFHYPAVIAEAPDIDIITGIIYGNGGRWLSADGTKVVINEPAVVDVVQLLVDLHNKYKVTSPSLLDIDYMKTIELFFERKFAMVVGMSWFPIVQQGLKVPLDFPYDMVPFPIGPRALSGASSFPGASLIIGAMWGISMLTSSKHKKEAFEFVKWISSDDFLIGYDGDPVMGRLPSIKKAYDSPDFEKYFKPSIVKAYREGTLYKNAEQMPAFPGLVEMKKVLLSEIQNAILLRKKTQEALNDAQKKCQEILERVKKK
jgi:ABC-type glycerol-3-phosphate transport system substrate-binding protein